MNPHIRKYVVSISVFSIVLILGTLIFFTVFPQWYFSSFPLLLLFFIIFHALLDIWTIHMAQKKPQQFSRQFMLMTTIKFMGLLLLLTIGLFFIHQKLFFGIAFLILFLLFLVLETVILYKISIKISNH